MEIRRNKNKSILIFIYWRQFNLITDNVIKLKLTVIKIRTNEMITLYWFCFHLNFEEWFFFNYLESIFETHPCETRSCLEMSQGRTPLWASSTIRCRTTSGSGRPLTKTPPNWLTPPWPVTKGKSLSSKLFFFL